MTKTHTDPIEIKLVYVMPILFIIGALINLGVSGALGFTLSGFNELSLKARTSANYGVDPFDLAFAPVNPDIISDVESGQNDPENEGGLPILAPATQTPFLSLPTPSILATATQTPFLSLPTPSILPTVPVPTLPLPTIDLPEVVETVGSFVDDAIDDVGDTIQEILPDLPLPTLVLPRLFP